MKIAITGAKGFIGQKVLQALIDQGHQIQALVRGSTPEHWAENKQLNIFSCDLLKPETLKGSLEDCDAVIHLAAIMSGANQYQQTIAATENLLAEVSRAKITKFIMLSSISVLNYLSKSPMSAIDENTSVDTSDSGLGDYARMKRDQENCCMQWQGESQGNLIILRPGIVYDSQQLSNAHVGFKCLAALHEGEVPVVHVNSVAQACALVAESTSVANQIIHLTNDQLPNQKRYIDVLKAKGLAGTLIPLPWQLYALLMSALRLPLGLINKIPDGVRRNSVNARQKPFRFSNEKAKKLLNWQPAISIED